ncbi:MAG: dynamin family protein [Desulfobacterales bacterium]
MNDLHIGKNDVARVGSDLDGLLDHLASISGMPAQTADNYRKICNRVQKQVSEEVLRVAVVGAIKSGKSTFVNSLLSGDYLKRGAGVITSIVTRIRKGSALKATLFFKSWDDVNADIEQAISLLPSLQQSPETGQFDIRRKKDRQLIESQLEQLGPDFFVKGDTLNAGCILLRNYLRGFEAVRHTVDSESGKVEYIGKGFDSHKDFVGDDALSVYLKDILLEIDADDLIAHDIELADCQGSDSPNPLHLAKIQDYLVMAHLTIYVISSRTGLRQADVRFLSIIKAMGILDNILFVVNCDFNEHETIEEMDALIEKVRQEISLIKPDPQVFAFSSLFILFDRMKNRLTKKDDDRLLQWHNMAAFAGSTFSEKKRLLEQLQLLISNQRAKLLFHNHLGRLSVVAEGIHHWIDLHQKVLAGDRGEARQVIEKISGHDDKLRHIQRLIKDTLDGGAQKLTSELKKDVDQFFSTRAGGIPDAVLQYVRNFRVNVGDYADVLQSSGFHHALFLIFQDFRQQVDRYMAETVIPRVFGYIKEKEIRIAGFLESIYTPYEGMVVEALEAYNRSVEKIGITPVSVHVEGASSIDLNAVKNILNLELPSAESTLRYSARIKTDATIRFGFYSVLKLVKKLFNKPVVDNREEAYKALEDGVIRMKREMERAILFHFKNYQENIKFQYLLKLVSGAVNFVADDLGSRFEAYHADLSKLKDLIREKGTMSDEAAESLADMKQTAKTIILTIDHKREMLQNDDST